MNEATKHDGSKTRVELLPARQVLELADVFTGGAETYGEGNYLVGPGLDPNRLYGAVQRHLLAWKSGELVDPETLRSHLMHGAAGLFMMRELETRPRRRRRG